MPTRAKNNTCFEWNVVDKSEAFATCGHPTFSLCPPHPLPPQRLQTEGRKPEKHKTRSVALDNVSEGKKQAGVLWFKSNDLLQEPQERHQAATYRALTRLRHASERLQAHPQCGCCHDVRDDQTGPEASGHAPSNHWKDSDLKCGYTIQLTKVRGASPSSKRFLSAEMSSITKPRSERPLQLRCSLLWWEGVVLGGKVIKPGDWYSSGNCGPPAISRYSLNSCSFHINAFPFQEIEEKGFSSL